MTGSTPDINHIQVARACIITHYYNGFPVNQGVRRSGRRLVYIYNVWTLRFFFLYRGA